MSLEEAEAEAAAEEIAAMARMAPFGEDTEEEREEAGTGECYLLEDEGGPHIIPSRGLSRHCPR